MALRNHPYHAAAEDPMESVAVRKTNELDPAMRQGLENVFGRPLRQDEAVTFISVPAHAAPAEAARRDAYAQLERVMDKAAENAKDTPEDELDATIDEAMGHVRKWRE